MTPAPTVRIEVWTDPQCIWCYLTHPRLDSAIAAFDGTVEVIYRSFLLHPDAPVDVDRDEHVHASSGGMSTERREAIVSHLTDLATAEGLPHHPERTQPTNSRRALELLHHAETLGMRGPATRRLSRAYFAEGRHLGYTDELLDLARDIGIDPHAAEVALAESCHADAVDRDTARARSLGAQGVPFALIGGTHTIGGALSTSDLLKAIRMATERRRG